MEGGLRLAMAQHLASESEARAAKASRAGRLSSSHCRVTHTSIPEPRITLCFQ